jgi:hypothetical protein
MVNGTQMDSIIYNNNRQFRSGVNMRTGRCCCDSVFSQRRTVYVYEQPKMPTAVKATFWSIAIKNFADIGMGIANFFMGIFGKKKASAPVQTPAATQNNKVTPDKQGVNTPIATPQKATTPQEVKPEKEENNNKKQTKEKKYNVPSSVDMKKFSGKITVHDDELFKKLGERSDITGETTVSEEIGQGGYPKELKVGNYKYTLERVDADGTVWYKSQNGNKQLYRLEKNNNNTYGLNQHAEDNGVGEADVSKWKKTTPTSSKKTQTPASTTTTTSTNNTQSTTTQANASQQKTTSTDKKTPASTSIRTDKELKDTMQINVKLDLKKIPTFNDMSTDKYGKPYSPMTVTYGLAPEELKTIDISAKEVADCQGDEAKIKDYALDQIKKEQQESQKAE